MNNNIITLTDSYKVTHAKQYPPGTEYVYSYFESRGGEFPETVFFGLQYILKRYLCGKVVTQEKIDRADWIYQRHFGAPWFNRAGWEYILKEYDGHLPVSIKAVAEGAIVPTRNVLMTVENTDPKCWWLTNYIETLLVQTWYPSTVATISRSMRDIIVRALEQSGTPGLIDYMLHDFGCRGATTMESAAIAGAAHLINFQGTDTVPALEMILDHYTKGMPTDVAGHSIPAAEHATITSWGEGHELDAYRNMLEQFPTGLVAVVSDSWDIYRACRELWGSGLRDAVMERDGRVIIRPDSGDPLVTVPSLLEILATAFGSTVNGNGYRVLPEVIRLIQGDWVKRHTIGPILEAVMARGFSVDNIAFGCGGGLVQSCDRDTSEYAFKCSQVTVNGEARDVFKRPVDMPTKASKRGRLKLVRPSKTLDPAAYATVPEDVRGQDFLVETFRNGLLVVERTFAGICERTRQAGATRVA